MTRADPEWCCRSICWILILIFIAWPLAIPVAIIWILLQPFEGMCRCNASICNFLERLVTWPRECGYSIVNCSKSCPHP